MPFCASCRMQFDGAACRLCGTKPKPPAPLAYRSFEPVETRQLSEGAAGAFCYVLGPLTSMIFLAWQPYNQSKLVRFNAIQSMFFFCFYLIGLFCAVIFLPSGTRDAVTRTLQITGMICWLYVMYRTLRGDKVVIPLIGQVAEKNA